MSAAASTSKRALRLPRSPHPTVPVIRLPQYAPFYRPRLQQHYEQRLVHDLLYLTYNHFQYLRAGQQPNPSERRKGWKGDVRSLLVRPEDANKEASESGEGIESGLEKGDLEVVGKQVADASGAYNPYTLNRPLPPLPGNRSLTPLPSFRPPFSPRTSLPSLSHVVVSIFNPSIIGNKTAMPGVLTLLSVLTASPPRDMTLLRTTRKVNTFKMRQFQICGAKVSLQGPQAYAFLETLFEVVLPRLKTFSGLFLPGTTRPTAENIGGQVSLGLDKETVKLFPQVEANADTLDTYGVTINVVCNGARGSKGGDAARALLSGWRAPYIRRT
ncbi:hypothetical protein BT69DRAFT_1270505 [Atractiella rhizophila]|nr:hypothetical protein BT69DRAFT_1270505 [Atractiella rhizophila]